MTDAMFAAQDAVYDTLQANAGVQAVLGNPTRVYDHVPTNAVFPYLTLGETSVTAYDVKEGTGMDAVMTLHVWSRYRGHKEVKDILKAVHAALHRATFSVAGQNFIDCRFESAETVQEADGLTYHGIARYRILTLAP